MVVSEGAKPIGGEVSVLCAPEAGGSAERLGGIGNKVGADIGKCTEMEVRVTVLGHLQRGGLPLVPLTVSFLPVLVLRQLI